MYNKYIVKFAEMDELASWMDLVTTVRYNFPLLESDEELENYRQTVIKNIKRNSAICALNDNEVVGILIFSYNQNCLSCMAVHPDHRRKGIASKMIEQMISVLSPDRDIWVITFRDDDEKGTAPRALYRKFGFQADELLIEHNYPHQKFILRRK